MIHHISIDAQEPLRVASVLAEIWQGKVYTFLVPGSFLVMPFDDYGTHIVVFKQGDAWMPGVDTESAKVRQTSPVQFMPSHAAISVPTSPDQIEQIGQREGWRVIVRIRGDVVPFSVVEFWAENRILFEFMPPEFVPQYEEAMRPESIQKMMGQPIQLASV
ncbi:hypothetical protein IQ265_27210 [Nodosilinea sp. LEGE 06152]|uniref:hypothetical protein n=1 Tax=Nodosilinea sp. LEGE 06152 TaxID=2777966 RepID=UPI0018812F29|nr:hypothetical protein [Nodosilinea sp. LEGE 06152]MBE9156634.1 hypothetical protein [Nodosilinea sp. LEGE 06152]MBE9160481.1 hypothetical protein [Nodosilinea sp. LEGE 06152]